jgi:hypothetical protein
VGRCERTATLHSQRNGRLYQAGPNAEYAFADRYQGRLDDVGWRTAAKEFFHALLRRDCSTPLGPPRLKAMHHCAVRGRIVLVMEPNCFISDVWSRARAPPFWSSPLVMRVMAPVGLCGNAHKSDAAQTKMDFLRPESSSQQFRCN